MSFDTNGGEKPNPGARSHPDGLSLPRTEKP
jgi:hypothetical protein